MEEKLKEGRKNHFLKNLRRAPTQNTRQRHMFAVGYGTQSVFAWQRFIVVRHLLSVGSGALKK
jgi:hypothetical protein